MVHELTAVSSERPDATPELDEVLRRATAKDPAQRYADAAQMAEGLRALLPAREDHLRSELRTRARHDFLGDMPENLDLDPLDELEQSWKTTLPIELSGSSGRYSDAPTQVNRPPPVADVPAHAVAAPRSMLAISIVAGVAIVAAATALGVAFWPSNGGPDRVVIVQQRLNEPVDAPPTATDATSEEAPSPDETPSTVGTVPIEPTQRIDRTPHRASPADRAAALTRLFNRRHARLAGCFEQHAQGVEDQPQVSMRFRIDRAGAVQEAELSPPALTPTPLGRCLLEVARSTRFGAQPDEIGFRIPIAVSGGPR